jgi:hypothetical protein
MLASVQLDFSMARASCDDGPSSYRSWHLDMSTICSSGIGYNFVFCQTSREYREGPPLRLPLIHHRDETITLERTPAIPISRHSSRSPIDNFLPNIYPHNSGALSLFGLCSI